MLNKIRPYIMPAAMLLGGFFYPFFSRLAFITPYLIFTMLLLTYCTLPLREIKFSRLHLWLILIQAGGCILIYVLLRPVNTILAQAAMICVLAPTATSAPVITRMLKGNAASITAYSLLCNTAAAIAAPVIFSFIGSYKEIPFWESFLIIARQAGLLLAAPFICAVLIRKVFPAAASKGALFSNISFVLWSAALTVVTGRITAFILMQEADNYLLEAAIGACSLIICIMQFLAGRKIGKKYGEAVAGGQALGQKNTVLAIWMAQTYLHPLSSLGPGTYVLWQNVINSYQVWRRRKNLE